jgi:hypothetical protein
MNHEIDPVHDTIGEDGDMLEEPQPLDGYTLGTPGSDVSMDALVLSDPRFMGEISDEDGLLE